MSERKGKADQVSGKYLVQQQQAGTEVELERGDGDGEGNDAEQDEDLDLLGVLVCSGVLSH